MTADFARNGCAPLHALRRQGECARRRHYRDAFSLRELIISIGIVTVLVGFLTTAVSKSRSSAQNVACISNLHSLSLGLTQWARDNSQRYPDPIALNESWEQLIHPYVSTAPAFDCPADGEVFPSVGSSYDWRDTSVAATTLAGQNMTNINRSTCVLTFESLPSWHFRGKMNAAHIDGSAQTMDQESCLTDLQTPIR